MGDKSAVNEIVAGSIGGAFCKLFEYPMDTIKVQLQTQTGRGAQALGPVGMLNAAVQKHGVLGLYR